MWSPCHSPRGNDHPKPEKKMFRAPPPFLGVSTFLLFRVVQPDPVSFPGLCAVLPEAEVSNALPALRPLHPSSAPTAPHRWMLPWGWESLHKQHKYLVSKYGLFPNHTLCTALIPMNWWWNGHTTQMFEARWWRAAVDTVWGEGARAPGPQPGWPLSCRKSNEGARCRGAFKYTRGNALPLGWMHTDEDVRGLDGAEGLHGERFYLGLFLFFLRALSQKWLEEWVLPSLPGRLGEGRVDRVETLHRGRLTCLPSGWGWTPPCTRLARNAPASQAAILTVAGASVILNTSSLGSLLPSASRQCRLFCSNSRPCSYHSA